MGVVVRRAMLALVVAVVVGNAGIASASALTVSAAPSNYPTFNWFVDDYVIRGCPATGGVSVNVTSDPGEYVSVDNQPAQTGTFTTTANVTTGQEFTIVETLDRFPVGTWYMRCLPTDFPDFTSTVTGTPQAQFFLTAATQPGASQGYATFFDRHGVPIWWYPAPGIVFANTYRGSVAWTSAGPGAGGGGGADGQPVPVVNLDGQKLATISSPDGPIDIHELQVVNNKYALVIVPETKCCTDLSSWGPTFPTNATIFDQVIEEIGPGNTVVWSWDALAHLNPVTETAPQWYSQTPMSGGAYDVFHMNSVDYYHGKLLVSFRHLDAIFGIDQSTGSIYMKIGGSQDPQSYTVLNDPVFSSGGTFCGQHDARALSGILSPATITLHDNGTNCGRAPRAVEYSLNNSAKTATLVTSVSDPRAPSSFCCGSARLLPGGDWVADWGGDPFISELTSSGTPVYTVNWTDPGAFAYRATPILPGMYSAAQLRAGMDAQYPNPAAQARSAAR